MPSMIDNILSVVGPYERIHELCQGALNNRFLQTVKPIGSLQSGVRSIRGASSGKSKTHSHSPTMMSTDTIISGA